MFFTADVGFSAGIQTPPSVRKMKRRGKRNLSSLSRFWKLRKQREMNMCLHTSVVCKWKLHLHWKARVHVQPCIKLSVQSGLSRCWWSLWWTTHWRCVFITANDHWTVARLTSLKNFTEGHYFIRLSLKLHYIFRFRLCLYLYLLSSPTSVLLDYCARREGSFLRVSNTWCSTMSTFTRWTLRLRVDVSFVALRLFSCCWPC